MNSAMHLCGGLGAPADVLRTITGLMSCCYSAAEYGPDACTCWEPEYDLEQAEPNTELVFGTRASMCDDCAYRPDSPERTGSPDHAHSVDDGGLPDIPADGEFWCHQGMRKPVRWRHAELGITVECTTDHYRPPMVEINGRHVAFKADGTPGDRCAGWAAHRRSDKQAVADEVLARAGTDVPGQVEVTAAEALALVEGGIADPASIELV